MGKGKKFRWKGKDDGSSDSDGWNGKAWEERYAVGWPKSDEVEVGFELQLHAQASTLEDLHGQLDEACESLGRAIRKNRGKA